MHQKPPQRRRWLLPIAVALMAAILLAPASQAKPKRPAPTANPEIAYCYRDGGPGAIAVMNADGAATTVFAFSDSEMAGLPLVVTGWKSDRIPRRLQRVDHRHQRGGRDAGSERPDPADGLHERRRSAPEVVAPRRSRSSFTGRCRPRSTWSRQTVGRHDLLLRSGRRRGYRAELCHLEPRRRVRRLPGERGAGARSAHPRCRYGKHRRLRSGFRMTLPTSSGPDLRTCWCSTAVALSGRSISTPTGSASSSPWGSTARGRPTTDSLRLLHRRGGSRDQDVHSQEAQDGENPDPLRESARLATVKARWARGACAALATHGVRPANCLAGQTRLPAVSFRRCGEEMEIVAWITQVDVIDRILRHRREKGLVSPFEP